MIPIKNKKKNLEATIDEMRNFALNYVEKFAPSIQQIKTNVLKKESPQSLKNSPLEGEARGRGTYE